jgi:hypothetical protein
MSRKLPGIFSSPDISQLIPLTLYHSPSTNTINMPAPVHIQRETIDKFLTAWENGKAQDTIDLWSDDFEQQLLPLSLQQPRRPRAHTEFFYPKLVNNLTNWKVCGTLLQ